MLKLSTASAVHNLSLPEAIFSLHKGLQRVLLLSIKAKSHLYLVGF